MWNTALLLTGFSNLNTQSERGPGAPINRCMWELVDYAGHCTGVDGRPGPQIVSFESVQAAYTKGRVLMQALRDHLESLTGQEYDLHHVLMSGGSVGAAQYRHRYYVVFSRIPFGVDAPQREDLPSQKVVTYYDAIGDLQGLDLEWGPQRYRYGPPFVSTTRYEGPSQYADDLRSPDGVVTQHMAAEGRVAESVRDACLKGWPAGKYLSEAFDALDIHPENYQKARRPEGIRRGKSSYKGLNWPLRINPNKSGYVQTGGCARDFAHWTEPRLLTVRELSRMMGYPDTWIWPQSISQCSMQIGKCCPVTSGRWISDWVARALEGKPGHQGKELSDGEGEYEYNFTNLYKRWRVLEATEAGVE